MPLTVLLPRVSSYHFKARRRNKRSLHYPYVSGSYRRAVQGFGCEMESRKSQMMVMTRVYWRTVFSCPTNYRRVTGYSTPPRLHFSPLDRREFLHLKDALRLCRAKAVTSCVQYLCLTKYQPVQVWPRALISTVFFLNFDFV